MKFLLLKSLLRFLATASVFAAVLGMWIAAMPATSLVVTDKRPRLLCLHGKFESGASFAKRLEPLQVHADLVSIDAPHVLDRSRTSPRLAWWRLPDGQRSFTTPVFEGWDETLSVIKRTLSEQGPFDGLLGFSQGAILIAALAALGVIQPRDSAEEKPTGAPFQPKCLLLFGAAVPGPWRRQIEQMASAPSDFNALHVIGDGDRVNPPESAWEVARALGGTVLEWPAGGAHDIPLSAEALAVYGAFLAEQGWCKSNPGLLKLK